MGDFGCLLDVVWRQLVEAQKHWDIVWALVDVPEEEWERRKELLDAFIHFFGPSRLAHLDRFFIKIWNAIEPEGESSLSRLIDEARRCPSLAEGLNIEELEHRLADSRDRHKAAMTYRHQRAAHHYEEARIPPANAVQCRELLETSQAIFNEIAEAHTGRQRSFEIPEARAETRGLMAALDEWFAPTRRPSR